MLYINILAHTCGILIGTAWCFLGLVLSGHCPIFVAVLVAVVYAVAGDAEIRQSLRS